MGLVIEAPPVPLRTDQQGVLRVGKTRVPRDTVVYAFNQGASMEEIVLSYSTLELGDVHAVINYYLHNGAEVDAYLNQREAECERIRKGTEKRLHRRASARASFLGGCKVQGDLFPHGRV